MTIFWPVTPLPDESLSGLVARAAGANYYPHAHDILVQAGLGHIRPETLAGKSLETALELAEVLGTSAEAIRRLYHPAVDERLIDFFGVPLRAKHRETRKRRLSPRAMQDKAYIKAVWSVRPITFDPQTREQLLSNCPVCGGQLGYTQTWRVECCEHCIGSDADGLPEQLVDLRDFPQPIIEVVDEEALDFVVCLVDPAPKYDRLPILHSHLSGLNRGELFELAISVANAIVAEEQGIPTSAWHQKRLPVGDVHPEALARAGRCLMNWPAGFSSLCAEASGRAASRQGQWGINKEFGAFAQLGKDPHLPADLRATLVNLLDQALSDASPEVSNQRKTTRQLPLGTYVGVRQLLRLAPVAARITTRMGAHPNMIKYRRSGDTMAPVSFITRQALHVLDHYLDLVSEPSVSVLFGLPPDGIRDLCDIGILDDQPGPARDTAIDLAGADSRYYSKFSADQLVDMVVQGLEFQKPTKGYISFSDAMLMFPAGRRPWLPVLMAVFFNRVDAQLHRNVAAQPKPRNLFGSISLRGIEQQRDRILEEHREAKDHDIGRVSAVAANLMLGIYNHHVFMACANDGLLNVDEDGAADYRSVLEFADRFIFGNEVAARSRNSPQAVGAWLNAHQIRPAYSFPVKGGLIFDRAAVEPWLELKA
ncbi:TniQ family protein [Devosia sp. A369]